MRPLYAIQFEVAPRDQSKTNVTDEVLRCLASWISEWYLIRKSVRLDFPLEGGSLRPCNGHELTVSRRSHSSEVAHSILSWSYPDENDGNLLWHTRCEVSNFGGMTEFSLQLSLESLQFYIAPVEFTLRRPRIIATLLREFRCIHGDRVLALEPRDLRAESMPEFVEGQLLSRSRRLPIVVVSRTGISEKWLVDPVAIADPVAGIAEVHVLEDKWAGFALSEKIGKLYSCYNGAVRIYWPDFDLAQTPYSPVYVPEKVHSLGVKLADVVFRQLAAISAFRYVPGPITVDAIDFLSDQDQRNLDAIRKAAQDRGDYEKLLEIADQENADLRQRVGEFRDEIAELKAKLQLSQENLKAIWQTQEVEVGAATTESVAEEEVEAKSVWEAVRSAQTKFPATLVFLESAVAS